MTDTITTAAHNVTTAPASGAALASLTGLAPGWYEVYASAFLSGTGTPAATDGDNVVLQSDGSTVATLPVAPAVNVIPPPYRFVVNTTTGAIQLAAGGSAGTASVTYRTFLTVAWIPEQSYLRGR